MSIGPHGCFDGHQQKHKTFQAVVQLHTIYASMPLITPDACKTVQDGSFDEAIQGCDAVIHSASPYILNVPSGTPCLTRRSVCSCTLSCTARHCIKLPPPLHIAAAACMHVLVGSDKACKWCSHAGKEEEMLVKPALKGTENILGQALCFCHMQVYNALQCMQSPASPAGLRA